MFGPPAQRDFSFKVIRSAAMEPNTFPPILPLPMGSERLSHSWSSVELYHEVRPFNELGVSNQMHSPCGYWTVCAGKVPASRMADRSDNILFIQFLFVDESGQIIFGKHFVGNFPQVVGGEGFDAMEYFLWSLHLSVVQEGLSHIQCGTFGIVACYAYLSDELFLGCGQLGRTRLQGRN